MQPLWKFASFTVNLGFDPRAGNAFSQAWTLSVEEQFYLVLPVLALLLNRWIGARWAIAAAVALVFLGIVLRAVIWDVQVGELVYSNKLRDAFAVYLRDVYYPTYTRLDGLVFGVLLAAARFYRPEQCQHYLKPSVAVPLGATLVVGALYLFSIRGPLEGTGLFLVFQAKLGAVAGFPLISLGIALLLGAMLDLDGVLGRWRIPGIATVATLSFSLYLTHKSVFHIDRLIFGKEALTGEVGFLIYIVTSFVVATALWFLVERTFLQIRDRVLTR